MTLQQLKYVSMIEKCGSFSKAAKKLYVSQPGISNLVHSLEKELGITIFIRSAIGITLTDEGRELLKLGNELLRNADYISEYFHSFDKDDRKSFSVSSQHYAFVISAFEELQKKINTDCYTLSINETQTSIVIDSVAKQYSELGVIFKSDYTEKHLMRVLEDHNLEFHSILKTKPHIFISKKHPLATKRFVTIKDLEPFPCIIYDQSHDSPSFFSEELILPDFHPDKVLYISDLYISCRMMKNCNAYDIGTGILAKPLSNDLAAVPIRGQADITLGWISLKNCDLSPIAEYFVTLLKKYIKA
ncbi:MAG: LysR family transcriptional regulator [Clostridia bacterium]|jgi:DNA-binding transcriptional LysR family regulator|nr:LysR family transcriptional regulator [Clostridia bacterium]